MLITGKFHDYYDSAIGYGGVDKTIVYKREPFLFGEIPWGLQELMKIPDEKKVEKKFMGDLVAFKGHHSWWGIPSFIPHNHNDESEYFFIIGFCGKTYLGYRYRKTFYPPSSFHKSGEKVEIHYGDDILEFQKKYETKLGRKLDKIKADLKHTKSYIDKFHNKENLDIFRKHNTPIYLETRSSLLINPMLKPFEFYKEFDSFTAFQEISMFMGGVLGSAGKELVQIDEKYRQKQAGMDKWSYRNPDPPKRKQKKK